MSQTNTSVKRKETLERRKTNLFIVLAGIFLTNAILAEIIGVKIFSAEAFLGLAPAQIKILEGYTLDFNLSAGVVLWPVVFLTSDIINEYFGKAGVRKISLMAAGFIAYVFLAIYIVTILPPADFWLEVNKSIAGEGSSFNINDAFGTIFRQGLGIIIGSLIAFLVGQLLDVYVFHFIRKFTGSKFIWARATGSTLVSQLVDSYVVLGIAFYAFGDWPLAMVFSVGTINYLYKGIVAVAMTPVLYVAHYLIDGYLGERESKQLTEEAANYDQEVI